MEKGELLDIEKTFCDCKQVFWKHLFVPKTINNKNRIRNKKNRFLNLLPL